MISALVVAASLLPGLAVQDAAAVYKKASPAVMTLEIEKEGGTSVGTAFLINDRGLAITAYHVIDGAKSGAAYFSDGEKFEISGLVDSDAKRDIALIKVKVADRPFLQFAQGHPDVGSKAFAIGAPRSLDFSISDGIISQVRRLDDFVQYQYTCPTSPGNSGGPLLNENSEVLGVVCWGVKESQNLNFATAGSYAKALDTTLATKPWTGVASKPSTSTEPPAEVNIGNEAAGKRIFELRLQALRHFYAMSDVWTLVSRVGAGNIDTPTSVWTATEELLDISDELANMRTADPKMNLVIIRNAHHYLTRAEGYMDVIDAIKHAKQNGWDGWATSKLEAGNKKVNTPLEWTEATGTLKEWTPGSFLKKYPDEVVGMIFGTLVNDLVSYDLGLHLDFRFHPALRVAYSYRDSLAEKADIRPADMILLVDGKTFTKWVDFESYLSEKRGQEVSFRVRRQKGGDATVKLKVPNKK